MYRPNGQEDQSSSGAQGNAFSRPPLSTINVIFAAPGKTGSHLSKVMSIARLSAEDSNFALKRARVEIQLALSFSDEDKIGTIQPHNDALMVTLKI